MTSEANRHFTLTYDNGLVTLSCALSAAFELVVERCEAGEKKARERASLHLRSAHQCRSC